MKLIDDETGEAPTLKTGDTLSFESTVIVDEDVVTEIPDAVTVDGEEVRTAIVRRASEEVGE